MIPKMKVVFRNKKWNGVKAQKVKANYNLSDDQDQWLTQIEKQIWPSPSYWKSKKRFTAKITSFSKCIFRVYLIQGCNQKISLYLVWKSIICSTKSLLNYPYIYFLKGEIYVLNLKRISVIRIDSLLILCISKLICRDQNKIYNFHLLTSSKLSAVRDKNNNECFILCNPGLQKE